MSEFKGANKQGPKTIEAIKNQDCSWFYRASSNSFEKIPGSPIAYWISTNLANIFNSTNSISDFYPVNPGIRTGKDVLFLRFWYEVSKDNTQFQLEDSSQMNFNTKWFPLHKGGPFRKWYGNAEHVIDLFQDGKNISLKSPDYRLRDKKWYFRPYVTWSRISSAKIAFRYFTKGVLFSDAGPGIFAEEECVNVIALLNSKLGNHFLSIINPTLNYQKQDIDKVPFIKTNIRDKIRRAIEIEKLDWDSYENSWDFQHSPLIDLLERENTIQTSYKKLISNWEKRTSELHLIEEENNKNFIDAYSLHEELTHDIPEHEISLNRNPSYRFGNKKTKEEYLKIQRNETLKELISYSVGCMMGRYSLDNPGLIYAHSENIGFDQSKYKSFPADDDGIIPIMDMDWFEDDAAKRFVEFIKAAWPFEHLNENLKFIADSLKSKANESPEDTIRRYLSITFFKDHMKMYKKRPIYWLISSGKQKAFECLVYLHRYNESTLSRIRSSYVTPLQGNFSARIEFLEHEKDSATIASTQKKIQKQIDVLKKKQVELKVFDDELRHYADMRISLDLDDGVKVNYGKFGNLLAQKKAITGKK